MVKFFALQSYQIEDFWEQILPFLLDMKGDWSPDDVKEELIESRAQLWGLMDDQIRAIVVTKLQIEGSVKRCLIWIASGKGFLSHGRSLLSEVIEPWAREHACSYVQAIGRAGWGRVLPDYAETGRVYGKNL